MSSLFKTGQYQVGTDASLVTKEPARLSSQYTNHPARSVSSGRSGDTSNLLPVGSTQREPTHHHINYAPISGREGRGRHFTVASVGNNGMIYLRPVQKAQQVPELQTSTFALSLEPEPKLERSFEQSHLQQPQTRTILSMPASAEHGPRAQRSSSQQTQEKSAVAGKSDQGAFRIVINRSDSTERLKEETKVRFPSIQVPIPHYRLGTPRFSDKGTAFLHHSTNSRVPMNSDQGDRELSYAQGSEYEQLFPNPPGVEAHPVLSRRHSHASPQPYSIQTSHGQQNPLPSHDGNAAVQKITPQIYDAVATNPNDPAIVRYSPINGDIIAATPARIIAQITSENFLDYELLSDFFLTVRAYLSTHDLLALLLARFEWAINRFDDNGRVIRVRAFAALRHWVLNYFSYDFVVDRDLRVKFCDRINTLTRLVKSREEYGASDLKLISDLKKCWNGRCSLFWDAPFSWEGRQDLDIQPGGIVGSRDSQLVHQSQLRLQPVAPQLSVNPAQITAGSTSVANWYSAVMEHGERQAYGHARQSSTTTSRSLPISPSSENSAPILSCSIPGKGFKRAYPYTNKALGIHPVPTATMGQRVCPAAPSSSSNETTQPAVENRRSGSFSDAARDKRAPLSSEVPINIEEYSQNTSFSDRSMLRGHSIPPGGPYVSAVASTPGGEISHYILGNSPGSGSEHNLSASPGSQNGPVVRNFIGSIRRALSSRHAAVKGSSPASTVTNSPAKPVLTSLGKSASVPLNVMFQATSSGQLESYRSIRVDLLAAEVYDSFHQARKSRAPDDIRGNVTASNNPQANPPSRKSDLKAEGIVSDRLRPPSLHRLNSSMTDSSQSILIVDDTGQNLPSTSRLTHDSFKRSVIPYLGVSNEEEESRLNPDNTDFRRIDLTSVIMPLNASEAETQNKTDFKTPNHTLFPGDSSQMLRSNSQKHAPAQPTSLRRYASYQSTFTKRSANGKDDLRKVPGSKMMDMGLSPARMLRRRPGGDLRANQNVQDLKFTARPASAGSITTYAESARGSNGIAFGEKVKSFHAERSLRRTSIAAAQGNPEPSLAKAQTPARRRSSQPEKRRPSFEAAVAQFAHIPDDEEGGIEATLLKLEGKYKSPVQSPTPYAVSNHEQSVDPVALDLSKHGVSKESHVSRPHLKSSSVSHFGGEEDKTDVLDRKSSAGAPHSDPREQLVSTLYATSDGSYNSVPLLERGADYSEDHYASDSQISNIDQPKSIRDAFRDLSSLRRLRHGSVAPTATTDSFLLDENDEFLSETSSELSIDTVDADHHTWSAAKRQKENSQIALDGQHLFNSSVPSARNNQSTQPLSDHSEQQPQVNPLTPSHSPTRQHIETSKSTLKSEARAAHPRHMPFILGCDTGILAQQFTLVEQDALREIDWRDLVDMRWQNTATSTTNWVEYLLTQDPLGIDLVTARFNIMVKWTLSEIVLTENVEERALTIMKYIHIAKEARNLNNYATLLQLTIALTSADCTRLSKTWNLVPEKDKEILQDLEMLVSPRRNFQNLRIEMEKANAGEGCIPVVALYIHDLTYNAQKPSELPGVATSDVLINFERYRSTAVIVKNLLRLIDASTKYSFQPVDGVIERCLWMACLTDEMIAHTSKQQEYSSI